MENRFVEMNEEELNSVDGGSITVGGAIVIVCCVVLVGSAVANAFNGFTDGMKE